MSKRHDGWRGCPNITMEYYNDTADPSLVATIDGTEYTFNYWDIEDALWNEFLDLNGITESDTYVDDSYTIGEEWEQKFNEYCQAEAYNYLQDVVFGGYFGEGSTDWRDNY